MAQYVDVIMTTRGDLVQGNASGDAARLAVGSAAKLLQSDGTDCVWSAMSGDATIASGGALSLAEQIHVRSATVSLTQAQIIALNATPVELIAAPSAGKAIVPLMIEFFHDYAVAGYTNGGGGHIVFEYGDGTDVVTLNASRLTDTADANVVIIPDAFDVAATGTAAGLAPVSASNFRITKATAEFADGDATNIAKIRVTYRVVTLLT